jgi:hypothetical protein
MTMDTTPLRTAYGTLLEAAATVAEAGASAPDPGQWDADRILAHVTLVGAATIATVSAVVSGSVATYDNRITSDGWTLDRVICRAGGNAHLRDRVRRQGEALCVLAGETALSDAELDTPVPTLLLSNGELMVDQVLPLRALLDGLAQTELPGHAEQLLALLPGDG